MAELTGLTRDLALAARTLIPVLEALDDKPADVVVLARKLDMREADVRRALFILEDAGLVRSTTFTRTDEGTGALG